MAGDTDTTRARAGNRIESHRKQYKPHGNSKVEYKLYLGGMNELRKPHSGKEGAHSQNHS